MILLPVGIVCFAESPYKEIYIEEYTCAEFVIGIAGECDKKVIKVCFKGDSIPVDLSTKENFINSVYACSFLYADDYPAVRELYISLFGDTRTVEEKFQRIYYSRYLSWENMSKTGSEHFKLDEGNEVSYSFRSYRGFFCKLPLSEYRSSLTEINIFPDDNTDQKKEVIIPLLPVSCRPVSLRLCDNRN